MLHQPDDRDLIPQEQREALLAELREEHLQQITGGCTGCDIVNYHKGIDSEGRRSVGKRESSRLQCLFDNVSNPF